MLKNPVPLVPFDDDGGVRALRGLHHRRREVLTASDTAHRDAAGVGHPVLGEGRGGCANEGREDCQQANSITHACITSPSPFLFVTRGADCSRRHVYGVPARNGRKILHEAGIVVAHGGHGFREPVIERLKSGALEAELGEE